MTETKAAGGHPNLPQRLLAIMGELTHIEKSGKTTSGAIFEYVRHDDVMRAVQPLLVKHGVLFFPTTVGEPKRDDLPPTKSGQARYLTTLGVQFVFINADDPTDTLASTIFGEGEDGSDKGIGKAYSYAVKVALQKALCLPAGDEADNEHGEQESGQAKPRQRRQAPPAQHEATQADAGAGSKAKTSHLGHMWGAVRAAKIPEDEVLRPFLLRNYGGEHTAALTNDQQDEVARWARQVGAKRAALHKALQDAGMDAQAEAAEARTIMSALNVDSLNLLSSAEWDEVIATYDARANEDIPF